MLNRTRTTQTAVESRRVPDPTPEEIRARAATERAEWDDAMHEKRRVGDVDAGPYTIPVVRTPRDFEVCGDS